MNNEIIFTGLIPDIEGFLLKVITCYFIRHDRLIGIYKQNNTDSFFVNTIISAEITLFITLSESRWF